MASKKKFDKLNEPSSIETAILAVLLEEGESTCARVHERLVEKGSIDSKSAYTTVKTYLERLTAKGWTESRKMPGDRRGTLLFKAVEGLSSDVVLDRISVFERTFDALGVDPMKMVKWFVRKGRCDDDDVAELEKLVENLKKGNKSK